MKHKTDVLVAWMRDLLLNSADAPFVINPTPVPELSPMDKAQVVQQVKNSYSHRARWPLPLALMASCRWCAR